MSRLFKAYRAFHEQAFIPIFTDDPYETDMLVESCLEAGMKGIEYTLRRPDAHEVIPRIRERYPELYLIAGSTLDSEPIVRRMRRRHPQLLTLSELDAMDVDGFVSMIGWTSDSIRRYCERRLVIPAAMTVNEAFYQIEAGAHFAKMFGSNMELVRRSRGDASFGYCPTMITGGVTADRIGEAMEAGAIIVGSGFDLTLRAQDKVNHKTVTRVMRQYLEAAQRAREKYWPECAAANGAERAQWLEALPHFHWF